MNDESGEPEKMQIHHSPASTAHEPREYYRRGRLIPHPESVDRYLILKNAVVATGFPLREAPDLGLEPLSAVHTPGYLKFLAEGWNRRGEIDATAEEILATDFARMQMHREPSGLAGQLGYYTADTSTPLRAGTWKAVLGTAHAAVAAAGAALAQGSAYALCRPPGHHAFADCASGFCYVNNAAAAAQSLRASAGERVAVVDIDVHHGNGTQSIFYQRADVLTVSIHADTSNYFPFYSGYADETGAGAGRGFNLNLPLAHGSGDREFLSALDQALARVTAFAPAALVVALGLDAAESDPLGVFKVTTDGFARAAHALASLGLPTAIVQEGGYLTPTLPVNLVAFLRQFDKTREVGA